jgi:hypothetical protein
VQTLYVAIFLFEAQNNAFPGREIPSSSQTTKGKINRSGTLCHIDNTVAMQTENQIVAQMDLKINPTSKTVQ